MTVYLECISRFPLHGFELLYIHLFIWVFWFYFFTYKEFQGFHSWQKVIEISMNESGTIFISTLAPLGIKTWRINNDGRLLYVYLKGSILEEQCQNLILQLDSFFIQKYKFFTGYLAISLKHFKTWIY